VTGAHYENNKMLKAESYLGNAEIVEHDKPPNNVFQISTVELKSKIDGLTSL
jgi:hypothetical protein